MSKYLYIVNPTSGKGRGKKALSIISNYCNNEKINHEIIETKYPLHAKQIIENEINNYSHVISVGGDGTLNEIVNGIKNWNDIILAVLPVGSGNDFSRNLSMSHNIMDNMSIIHNSNKSQISKVDIGNIIYSEDGTDILKKHKFINSLGIGFDAYVGFLNQNNKYLSGIFSYLFSVVRALFKYKMIELDLKSGPERIIGERLMLSIGNGTTSGGGFYLNPKAIIDDGILDLSVFDCVTRRRLLIALPLALLNKLDKIPEAKQFITEKVELKLKTPYYTHCDGEIVSDKLKSAEISIEKQVLSVIKKKGK